jgi:hypothetical protein
VGYTVSGVGVLSKIIHLEVARQAMKQRRKVYAINFTIYALYPTITTK